MKSAQTARRRSTNHAIMNRPDVYDCFALRAKLFNTFGDLLQIGVADAACVGQIRGTLCDKIKRKHKQIKDYLSLIFFHLVYIILGSVFVFKSLSS